MVLAVISCLLHNLFMPLKYVLDISQLCRTGHDDVLDI